MYDLVIVGGGIIGLATARAWLVRHPGDRLLLLEKESRLAAHQSSHNSGVIHSGLYYRPGSLKAALCVRGAKLMVEFCRAHRIPHRICGKVVVATAPQELPGLETLYQRGLANGVLGLSLVGSERLRELEPHVDGLRGLHVPSAGVVDYGVVAEALRALIEEAGGTIRTSAEVRGLTREGTRWILETASGAVTGKWLMNCGGLHADALAAMAGVSTGVRIIPFRGEYYQLREDRRGLVRALVYPVPDPAMPFLGVHFTKGLDGSVHAGPNAVLAFKREGYRKTDVDGQDLLGIVTFGGFWKMASRHWRAAWMEWRRSCFKPVFVRALQRLVPALRSEDLLPGPGGVRAQAVDARGRLLDDFHIAQGPGALHLLNVPSPAATASLAIGEAVTDMASAILQGDRPVSAAEVIGRNVEKG